MSAHPKPRKRSRCHTPLAAIATIALCCAARGQNASAPEREIGIGAARISFDVTGVFAVSVGGVTRISRAGLQLFGPEWRSVAQSAAQADPVVAGDRGTLTFSGRLTEPVSGQPWLYREEVTPGKDRVEMTYVLEPQTDMEMNEVSLVLDLPIDLYRGKRLLIYPGTETVFPAELPAEYHFVAGRGRDMVFGAGESPQVALAFPQAAYCNVQDTRQWNGDVYQAFVKIIAGAKRVEAGDRYELRFALIPDDTRRLEVPKVVLESPGPLAIRSVTPSAERVARYGLVELRLDLSATYHTPFDPDEVAVDGEFTAPSGKRAVVPGFYYQAYEGDDADGPAGLLPKGPGEWRVRFAPTEVGSYMCKVAARDKSGRVAKDAGTFTVAPSTSHGYVRVSPTDRRYFAFDDGTPYFPIGENVCWYGSGGVADYDVWFGHLGENHANYARIWMPVWAFGIEWGKPGVYRLDRAWLLDRVLDLAEREGIYVKLCLESFRRWSDGPSPYDAKNGGPCVTEMDIFSNPSAREMFRKRLRYIVARWGYRTNIMGWELWNEIDCVNGYARNSQSVVDWTDEMCRYLKEIDPWQHLTTNSLGSCSVDDRYWSLPSVDWAQVHGYYYFSDEMKRDAVDMASFLTAWLGRIEHHDKPALFAEFGLNRGIPEVREMCDRDTEGVHLHNGLWAPALSGGSGTAMLWWWDSYVEPKNLYGHFRAIANFADGVPWTTARFRPVDADPSSPQLRVFGLQGDRLTILWLQNARHTWWNVVHGEEIGSVEGASVRLPKLPPGSYRVEWWDTYEGRRTATATREATAEGLTLEVPPVPKDVAVKITRR